MTISSSKIEERFCSWKSPSSSPVLSDMDIHVWGAQLDLPAQQIMKLECLLSAAEKSKARRFHSRIHRNRYIVAHGVLRIIVGRYLNLDPKNLKFTSDTLGKPSLCPAVSGESLSFNMSHSYDRAVYAIASHGSIGIDIEHMRMISDIDTLARGCFTDQEYREYLCAPIGQRVLFFYELWTCKEAYLKATGQGLGTLRSTCMYSRSPDKSSKMYSEALSQISQKWFIWRLKGLSGFAAALAAYRQVRTLHCFRMDELNCFMTDAKRAPGNSQYDQYAVVNGPNG